MTALDAPLAASLPQRPAWRLRLDGWTAGTLAVAALVGAPVAAVLWLALGPTGDLWGHLIATALPRYLSTTVLLMLGVGAGTLFGGVATAWIVTMCRFPGRRIFEWALLLPLAVPAYVIAYVYTDLLEYAGPVQSVLRGLFGWTSKKNYWFPEVRSLGGAAVMMTLVLYPYVYLVCRAAFLEQSVCVLEVSRTLGRGPWQSFWSVALPLARPAIVVGVTLALMETLNDFGTVHFFAVATFTAGIYDVWLNMHSLTGAAQLAAVMLILVFALIVAERLARRGQRYHHTTTKYRPLPGYPLRGGWAVAAFVACLVPVVLGFLVPAAVLAAYTARRYEGIVDPAFLGYVWNSLSLSALAALLALAVGTFLAYAVRLRGSRLLAAASRFASIGYAVPGAVLAIGVIVPLAGLDNVVDGLARRLLDIPTGLLLSGTAAAIAFGYVVRFLALSHGAIEASLTKVTAHMDDAARSLGHGPAATLRRVHLPMIRGSVLTAAVLVFVDGMKELPMTVILRPFNFQTLATYVHQFASDEQLAACAPGALTIVATGILPVILLSRAIAASRPGHAAASDTQMVAP